MADATRAPAGAPTDPAGEAAQHLRSLPAGRRVRLAKRTSNLFRGRRGDAATLDLSAFGSVIDIDPAARRAWVQPPRLAFARPGSGGSTWPHPDGASRPT